MKETGIAFQGPMVRAILRDVDPKTVTRRIAKLPHMNPLGKWEPTTIGVEHGGKTRDGRTVPEQGAIWHTRTGDSIACPHGQPGDILYVREAVWMWCERRPNGKTGTGRDKWRYVPLDAAPVHYQVDHPAKPAVAVVSPDTGNLWCWRLKIARFMPRRVRRIRLEITDIRIERLQEITEADAIAEGVHQVRREWDTPRWSRSEVGPLYDRAAMAYCDLWCEINGRESWNANPFVWCIYFRRVES